MQTRDTAELFGNVSSSSLPGRTGGSKASSVCGAMLTSTSTFLGRWKYVKLVLDLARRWWRLKVKDMSPEKLQIISPTQLRPPQVFGLSRTQFDICYILNYQALQMTSSSSRNQEPVMLLWPNLHPQPLFESVPGCEIFADMSHLLQRSKTSLFKQDFVCCDLKGLSQPISAYSLQFSLSGC